MVTISSFFKILLLLLFFTLQYCIGFAIHQHENMNMCTPVRSGQSGQLSSVSQLCLTLCDPMNCSNPGFPVHHQLLESTQTHVYCVGDAIQPSHPQSSPSPPALNLSQHQGLFK